MKTNLRLAIIMMVTLVFLFLVTEAMAAVNTYDSDDVPKTIPTKGTIKSSLTVPDSVTIIDINVELNIKHSYDGDLVACLIAPDGTEVMLFDEVGGDGDGFTNTILDDEAATSIKNGSAPFTGSYRPEGNLADLDGLDAEGTWKLKIADLRWGLMVPGFLNSWRLVINEVPEPEPEPEPEPPPEESGGNVYKSNDIPKDIPDVDTIVSSLDVPDSFEIADVNIVLSIMHTYDSDLIASLVAPDGTEVVLFTNVGDGGINFKNTILNDEAVTPIADGSAPFTGLFLPEGNLADFDGLDSKGTWQLKITDDSKMDSGVIQSWCLIIQAAPVFNDPVANCQDVTVLADKNCQGIVTLEDIDCGSYDPDGDTVELSLDPEGPYAIGVHEVTLTVTDESGASATCTATVTVLPTAYCYIKDAIAIVQAIADDPNAAVDPIIEDPNDPNAVAKDPTEGLIQAIDDLTMSLGNDVVVWAGPNRIAQSQGGYAGAKVFELQQSACASLDAYAQVAEAAFVAEIDNVYKLLAEADKMLVDTAISDAIFQSADPDVITEAKMLRNEANYAEAWQMVVDSLYPAVDSNRDGTVDLTDLTTIFTEDVLDILTEEGE